MNSDQPKNIRDELFAKIDRNELRMHSRVFFILKIAGIVALAIAVLIVSVLIGNFVFFTLRVNGQEELLNLGSHGWLLFLQVFPWWLVALDIILILLLERLLRQFRFGYRSPMLYIFLALVAIAAVGGALLDRGTPLNDMLLHQADQGHLPPPLGALYQDSRRPPPPGSGMYRGSIISIATSTVTISDPDHDAAPFIVQLPQQGPAANEHFSEGEVVLVIGHESNGTIQAMDIHPLDPNDIPPHDAPPH